MGFLWQLKTAKNPPAMRETWVRSLSQEDTVEKSMAIHFSILAWRIAWTEETGGLQSMGSQRVGHNWATNPSSWTGVTHAPRLCPMSGFPAQEWSITASASWPLWCLLHKPEVWEPGGLTFPSAPSSTPSRPMISFRLTAPADCLPPSSFKSLQGQAKDKDASVCTRRSNGDVYHWNTRVTLTIMMEEVPPCLTGFSLSPSFGASQ